MRSIDPILAAAMLAGSGEPIARAAIGGANFDLINYKWDNLKFSCTINAIVTATIQDILTVARGLTIGVTEYTVAIGSFYIESIKVDSFGRTVIIAHALPNGAATNIDGDDDILTVLNRVGAVYGCTFKGIPAVQTWLDTWIMFKAGSLLNLTSSKQIEALMRTKRRALVFQRSDGIYITNPAVDQNFYSSIYTLTLPEIYDVLTPNLRNYIIYWKDENNFLTDNYAGGGVAPASAPRQNVGFVHSSVVANEVGALGVDGGGEWRFTQFPNLAFEQGDPVQVDGTTTIIKFVETFNYPQYSGWKQVVSDQHWQPFGVSDPIIVQEGDEYITNLVTNIVNNYINEAGHAAQISADTSTFNSILNSSHTVLQSILETLDDHFHDDLTWLLYERFY